MKPGHDHLHSTKQLSLVSSGSRCFNGPFVPIRRHSGSIEVVCDVHIQEFEPAHGLNCSSTGLKKGLGLLGLLLKSTLISFVLQTLRKTHVTATVW